MSGLLEQRVVQLDAVRARKAGQCQDVATGNGSPCFPYGNHIGANAEGAGHSSPPPEFHDHSVHVRYHCHAPKYLRNARRVKGFFRALDDVEFDANMFPKFPR